MPGDKPDDLPDEKPDDLPDKTPDENASRSQPDQEPLRCEVADGVGWLTLNRPANLNALNAGLMWSLIATLERLHADPTVRVLVLTGAGRGFCAGGDIYGLDEVLGTGSQQEKTDRLIEVVRIVRLLYEGPKPSIAMINGACAGAGLGLACATDIRIASSEAVFTTAFLAIGTSGDYAGTWTLPRIVGPAVAKRLYLESDRFDAAEALRIGLVDGVYPPDELAAEAGRRAARLAGFSPLAIDRIRANFRDSVGNSFAEHLRAEAFRMVETQASPESRRAVAELAAAIRARSQPRGER